MKSSSILPGQQLSLMKDEPGLSPLDSLPPDTPEQALVTGYTGSLLVVRAYAGTGKTSTLVKYALRNPNISMLYLAFNRAIRDEAASKFPHNVDCKTSHQLAFAALGKRYAHKLSNNLRLTDIVRALAHPSWKEAKLILSVLQAFMASPDDTITPVLMPEPEEKDGRGRRSERNFLTDQTVLNAQLIWDRMIDPEDDFPIVHDGYLKLYQMQSPDLSSRYQTILFDEAQDSNPVTNAIVLSQHKARIIYVGDDHQQIYRFRGASNAMKSGLLKNADIMHLTHSFRFGPQVATVANVLLMLKGESRPVIGRGGEDQVLRSLPQGATHYTVLCRTVMGVIGNALMASLAGMKVYWVGGIRSYQLGELEDIYWLALRRPDMVQSSRIKSDFRDYGHYEEVAKATKDPEMLRAIALLDAYSDIPNLIQILHKQSVSNEKAANITVSTSHRSKGLEWHTVVLADDFPDVFDPDLSAADREDEINLLYVASTRARRTLVINDAIDLVLRYAKGLALKKQSE